MKGRLVGRYGPPENTLVARTIIRNLRLISLHEHYVELIGCNMVEELSKEEKLKLQINLNWQLSRAIANTLWPFF